MWLQPRLRLQRTGSDFIDIFAASYQKAHGENQLGAIFAEKLGSDGITYKSTDQEVKELIKSKVSSAVDNAYEVIRSRIDQYGVAQPNIQILRGKGQLGQIMVEMPGVTDPEDVQQLLTGSANLEFWTTFNVGELGSELAELRKQVLVSSIGGNGLTLAIRRCLCSCSSFSSYC